MDRTFTMDRVPSGRVGNTKKLRFQSDAHNGLLRLTADDLARGIPGSTAGGAPYHLHGRNLAVRHPYVIFRGAETVTVMAQSDRPGQAASGGWCGDPGDAMFFTGGHYRYLQLTAEAGQVVRKIGML